MSEIIQMLPVLAVAVGINIATGMYYSIGTKKVHFNLSILITGIAKALTVAVAFIGSAFCFVAADLSSTGITPSFAMSSAILLYVGKALKSLGKILGIEIK